MKPARSSHGLNDDAAAALRQFVKKNRPSAAPKIPHLYKSDPTSRSDVASTRPVVKPLAAAGAAVVRKDPPSKEADDVVLVTPSCASCPAATASSPQSNTTLTAVSGGSARDVTRALTAGGGTSPPDETLRDLKTERGVGSAKSEAIGALSEISTATESGDICDLYSKFDIFDNVDDDRIRDFLALFAKARAESNIDEFKKKGKKVDPNKFSTCNGVANNDDGQRILH